MSKTSVDVGAGTQSHALADQRQSKAESESGEVGEYSSSPSQVPVGRKAFRGGREITGQLFQSNREPAYKVLARKIVDNNITVVFTMTLTMYALAGDDFRLMFTNSGADPVFNWMVGLCILVFAIEFFLSVLGKKDYVFGFFFWLDLISTASLVLDITLVSDAILAQQQGSGGADASDTRSSTKAAKIGAKAGRVVRVLRLVRILKLYKAVYEAKARQKRAKAAVVKRPGEDDDWDDEDLDAEEENTNLQDKESHVGRKLSEMTTRRVICLILAMMLGLPLMQADESELVGSSAEYGADNVMLDYLRMYSAGENQWAMRQEYENSMLRYIYYHNWFASRYKEEYCQTGHCAQGFYAHLFWVGIRGKDPAVVEANARTAKMVTTSLRGWEDSYNDTVGIYNYGTMPQAAQDILVSDWDTDCDTDGESIRGISLLKEEIPDVVSHQVRCPKDLRMSEVAYYSPMQMNETQARGQTGFYIWFAFDLRPYSRTEAQMNLINTASILTLLIMVSLAFTSDANRLIVHPVERMIDRVEAIRDNPLIAMKMADEEFKNEELAKARKARAKKEFVKHMIGQVASGQVCTTATSEPMETVILEKTIIKLGSLLALGFGEAGANIIGHNMRGGDSAGVDAMIPGLRVECIIGVVRIRDFSTATEVLQSKIMTFVNQIAEIVHGVVNEYLGAPNRNSGESFLVIWRLGDNGRELTDPSSHRVNLIEEKTKLAGMSVVACAKILGGLHKSALLATYRGHPGLQYRLGANCRVNLSFGLHAGWAIEGAVGTEFKIDASYLSPNVSIATSVERATQAYNVSLMVAKSVVELCPKGVVSKCRLIDRVIITGSSAPMEIYCVDLDYRSVQVDNEPPLNVVWNTRNRFKVRQFLESEKSAMDAEGFDVGKVFDADPTIKEMRKRYTVEFIQLFNMGFQNYSQGEWQVARRMLSCTRAILGTEDGPSSALLRHMEVPYQFEAPREWRGVRELVTSTMSADSA